jgi:type I restriction-modification system DNA methylase subunit
MNLFLHGVGPDDDSRKPPIETDDALRNEPPAHADVVMTNPPFGKKSSITVVNEEGESDKQSVTYNRPDFWTTTSNKQLNFVQHVKSLLKIHGRAAVVVPDNVLFEGGAGETVRRKLMHECDLHTVLRLPTGIFYAQGVKANVLFFERKPGSDKPWTRTVWVYDLRTNLHFTLKENPLSRADLDEFVECYRPGRAPETQADVVRGDTRRPVAPLWLRRDRGPRQGQPRPLLAAGRKPGRLGQPARSPHPGRGDRRGPARRPRADRERPRGTQDAGAIERTIAPESGPSATG